MAVPKVAIFPKNMDDHSEGVGVLIPGSRWAVKDAAAKDLPKGCPFVVMNAAEVPNMEYIEAFEADFSYPDGYGTREE